MAERDDIMKRVRKLNPAAVHVLREFDRICAEAGAGGASVTVTEDMTDEEQEMALFEGYLTEGYPIEVAAAKAKEFLALTKRLF